MRKIVYVIFFLVLPYSVKGQNLEDKRWFSQAEVEITIPRRDKVLYSFSDINTVDITKNRDYRVGGIVLDRKVLWGTNYSINYQLFRRWSIGALGGFTYLSYPSISVLKLGGVIRFDFSEEFKANAFLQLSDYIPLKKSLQHNLGEIKLGLSIPVLVEDKFSINASLYTLYSTFHMAKPLFADETPDLVEYRGVGFGFGIRF